LTTLTADDVLAARAAYDHVHTVRAIGPAIVLTLERDAPMRMDSVASTTAEFDALREWIARDRRIAGLLDVYFTCKADEEHTGNSDLARQHQRSRTLVERRRPDRPAFTASGRRHRESRRVGEPQARPRREWMAPDDAKLATPGNTAIVGTSRPRGRGALARVPC
jgi:hypothetical protein